MQCIIMEIIVKPEVLGELVHTSLALAWWCKIKDVTYSMFGNSAYFSFLLLAVLSFSYDISFALSEWDYKNEWWIYIHLHTCIHPSEFLAVRGEHKEVCVCMCLWGCGCSRDSIGVSMTAAKSGRTGEMSTFDKTDQAERGIYERFVTSFSSVSAT